MSSDTKSHDDDDDDKSVQILPKKDTRSCDNPANNIMSSDPISNKKTCGCKGQCCLKSDETPASDTMSHDTRSSDTLSSEKTCGCKQKCFCKEDMESNMIFSDSMVSELVLKTNVKKCLVCGIGDVKEEMANKNKIVVYSRTGTTYAYHVLSRCNNRNEINPCRTSYFHNYYRLNGHRVFSHEALKDNILVTSDQTAFSIDFLIEIVLDIGICSGNFEALSKKYSLLHNRRLPTHWFYYMD